MSDSRQLTVDSSQSAAGLGEAGALASDLRLATVNRVGEGSQSSRPLLWGLAVALAGVLATRGVASAQYLAVFVDGRILAVTGARAVDGKRFHLDLKGGGSIDVPLSRIDRVIADDVEPEPAPIPAPPACRADYVDLQLAPGTPFSREIREAARAARINPLLIRAVVSAESGFKPWAVSRVGACGLMQLMPSVWLEQGVKDPYDPAGNLRAGCRHLRALLDRFGELPAALAAYNAGVATVERSRGIPPYRETREYVRRVLAEFCRASGAAPGGAAEPGRNPI